MKDISFWCIVLSIVVIFIFHHILTSTIEGLENGEEEPRESENSEMTVEINFSEPPSPVSCIGSWSSCSADCEKKYNITTARVGDGIDCPYQSGEIESCSPGEGECQEVAGDETLDDTLETTPGSGGGAVAGSGGGAVAGSGGGAVAGSDAGQTASTTTTTTTSPLFTSCSGSLRKPNCGIQKSSETCNGYTTSNAPNGKGYHCIWDDGKNSCESYLPGKQNERLCNLETPSGGDETPEICIGGANYVGPNTDPMGEVNHLGCEIYNYNDILRQNCNDSFQMDVNGIYRQCYLDDTDIIPDGESGAGNSRCKPKDTTCNPLLNSDNKPECKYGSWVPYNTDIFDCVCPVNTNILKENYKVPHHKGLTKCLERDRLPTYHITTCGKEGKDPPTSAECSSSLSSNSWFNDSNIYSYSNGQHTLNLQTGKYVIEIAGGAGGRPRTNSDEITVGKGAILRGVINLSAGEYKIVIGQNGKKNGSGTISNGGGGGGGGSFFWMNGEEQPLIVAGGGGGAGIYGHPLKGDGGNGSLTPDGTMGPIVKNNSGADPMNQHDVGDFAGKNGGDGGRSGNATKGGYLAKGWNTLKQSGFTGAERSGYSKEAGFGGGGVSNDHGGGGGGGYSGGGVFDYQSTDSIAQNRPGTKFTRVIGGGGGGSIFDTNFTDKEDSSTLGYNDGGGYIKIWGPY